MPLNRPPKVDIEKVVDNILQAAAIPPGVHKLSGQNLGRFFDLSLTGELSTAARRVGKILRTVRTTESLRDIEVALPDSSRFTKVFIDSDKSKNMFRTEILTKKLGVPWNVIFITDLEGKKERAYKKDPAAKGADADAE